MTSLTGTFQTDLPAPDALAACAEAVHGLGWKLDSVQPSKIVSHANSGTDRAAKVEVALSDSGSGTEVRITGSDSEGTPLSEQQLIDELDRARDAIETAVKQSTGEHDAIVPEEPEEPEQLGEPEDAAPTEDGEDGAEAQVADQTTEREVPAAGPNGEGASEGVAAAEGAAVAAGAAGTASREERQSDDESSSDEETETEAAAETAPRGWYDDYDGPGERFWDGEQWTDEVRPKGQQPFDHESAESSRDGEGEGAKEEKPSGKERRRRRAEERRRLAEEERKRAEEEHGAAAEKEREAERRRPASELQPSEDAAPARAEPQPVAATQADGHGVAKDVFWGLSLAFGAVAGSAAAFDVPDTAFFIPLCFGIAGLALAVVAFLAKGKTPIWAAVAVIASVGGIAIGVHKYSNYNDAKDKLDNAQKQLQQLSP